MSLEHAVSRAVMKARLVERALHSDGEWTIQIDGTTATANRTILDDRIVFSALFTEPVRSVYQWLNHDGVPLSVQSFAAPDFAPFIVDWELSVQERPVGV